MSDNAETTTETSTDTVPGVKVVAVKVLGSKREDGSRGKCIVNGYVRRPGVICRVPKDKALELEGLGLVTIEGI